MPRPAHVHAERPVDHELLRPLVGAGGPTLASALQALITYGASTRVRRRLMAESGFPLPDDLQAFLLVNQLIYRGSARPTDLADAIDTSRSNISKIVRRLEVAGLITRGPDGRDERAVVAVLTPLGREVGARIVQAATIGAPPAPLWEEGELDELERLVIKLAKSLDALPEHPLTYIAGVPFSD